jgi:hypothetical protein
MKTKLKKVMLVAMIVLFTSLNAVAFEDSLKVNETKSFDLVLSEVSNSTTITLKDRRNNILYSQSIEKGESFAKTFNLELLPEGDYTVEIENAIKVKAMNLVVGEETVMVSEASESEFYKPVVTGKGSIVYVTKFAPDNAPLYVAIYNMRNELVYEETLEGKIDLGKKYDFSKSYDGAYRFHLESNGMAYNHLVSVEK